MEHRSKIGRSWADQITSRVQMRWHADPDEIARMPKLEAVDFTRKSTYTIAVRSDWSATYVINSQPPPELLEVIGETSDPVNSMMYKVIANLAGVAGDLATPPPIQSRMYQELSNGMIGFNSALKIADVPFPIPYAQLLSVLLLGWALTLPVFVTAFTNSMVLAPILCFLLFEGIWCLNEVAKELENPYGGDDNDISLPDFHGRFVDLILDVPKLSRLEPQMHEPAKGEELNGASHTQAGSAAPEPPVAEKTLAPQQKDPPRQLQSTPIQLSETGQQSCLASTPSVSAPPKQKSQQTRFTDELELQLIKISARMEQHLAKISGELPLVSLALAELSSSHSGFSQREHSQGPQNDSAQSKNLSAWQHECTDRETVRENTSMSETARQGKLRQI